MDAISWMESRKGNNHDPSLFGKWIERTFGPLPFLSVQVAGTNGKGSVCSWLAAFCQESGISYGLFISPHLLHHSERIQVNGSSIPEKKLISLIEKWKDLFERENFTMFEMDLWIAIDYFLEKKVSFVIFETGLGGRRDAVSSLFHPYAVLTTISYDHMNLLGESLKQIAWEKSGIFKPGQKVYLYEKEPEIQILLKEEADNKGTALEVLDLSKELAYFSKRYPALSEELEAFPIFQRENFLLAYNTFCAIFKAISLNSLKASINHFFYAGRFQVLRDHPLLLIDGAHNEEGIDRLIKAIQNKHFEFQQIYFSVLADKQAETMISLLKNLNAPIRLVEFESGRLADLKRLAEKTGCPIVNLDECLKDLNKTSLTSLCCGSLYFIAEILKFFEGKKRLRLK